MIYVLALIAGMALWAIALLIKLEPWAVIGSSVIAITGMFLFVYTEYKSRGDEAVGLPYAIGSAAVISSFLFPDFRLIAYVVTFMALIGIVFAKLKQRENISDETE